MATSTPSLTSSSSSPYSDENLKHPAPVYIHYRSLWGRTIHLSSDPAQAHILYSIDVRMRKPNMTFKNTNGGIVGTCMMHYGRSIEFKIHGREFVIPIYSKLVSTEWVYKSELLGQKDWKGEREVVWKSMSSTAAGEIVCLEKRGGRKLGRSNQHSWTKDLGVIEFEEATAPSRAAQGEGELDVEPLRWTKEALEEMIVVGVSLAVYRQDQAGVQIGVASAVY